MLRRRECLSIGIASTALAVVPMNIAWDWLQLPPGIHFGVVIKILLHDAATASSDAMSTTATLAVILGLLGALAGWLFWRVSIFPAPPVELDVGSVFE